MRAAAVSPESDKGTIDATVGVFAAINRRGCGFPTFPHCIQAIGRKFLWTYGVPNFCVMRRSKLHQIWRRCVVAISQRRYFLTVADL